MYIARLKVDAAVQCLLLAGSPAWPDRVALNRGFKSGIVEVVASHDAEVMPEIGAGNVAKSASENEAEKLHTKIGQLGVERHFLAKGFGR